MTNRKVNIVILCEDRQQDVFARAYFEAKGVHRRKLSTRILPQGKQSAEQYVRERYPHEVQTLRRKSAKNHSLVVMIDADTVTVAERQRQLKDILKSNGLVDRKAKERIAIFVPKRNIETWVYFAMGHKVDEERDFAKEPGKLKEQSACVPHAVKLATEICPRGLPVDAPSSLQIACSELRRVL